MKFVLRLLVVVGVFSCAWLGYVVMSAHRGLAEGERLLKRNALASAHTELAKYLWLHPHDSKALLLAAEAYTKDETIESELAITRAQQLLSRIADTDPRGPEARAKQARLAFFVEHKPVAAKRYYERAIELKPDFIEARYLLWKLLDLSGRSDNSEDLFWTIYDLTPEIDRPVLMREWYMSQFFPATANPMMDVLMGFNNPEKPLQINPEYVRLKEHRQAEPNEPANHAALARWFQHDGDHATALTLLEAGLKVEGADQDPFFLSILLASLFEKGELERAREAFKSWPEPHTGYDYYKWKAMLADEADRDYETAVAAYSSCLETWPGPVDWRTMYRKANCLARLRRSEDAKSAREIAKSVELQMEVEIHQELRDSLADHNLQDPAKVRKVQAFYKALGRTREVDCWEKVIETISRRSSGN